jgi:hypothetical protein
VSSGTALYLIYFPVLLVLAGVFFGWTGFLSGLLVPLAGYLVLFYQEIFCERIRFLRFKYKSITNKPLVKELATLRSEIQDILTQISLSG